MPNSYEKTKRRQHHLPEDINALLADVAKMYHDGNESAAIRAAIPAYLTSRGGRDTVVAQAILAIVQGNKKEVDQAKLSLCHASGYTAH